MKYVAFIKPDEALDGLDWIYDLLEDKSEYAFFLVEAKKPETVREKVANELYNRDMKEDIDYVIERAFEGFCGMEYEEDQEIFDYFGEKDGKTVFEFYDKYTWDAFFDDKFSFFGISPKRQAFPKEDREKFSNFDKENLEKLYKRSITSEILVLPITKELK